MFRIIMEDMKCYCAPCRGPLVFSHILFVIILFQVRKTNTSNLNITHSVWTELTINRTMNWSLCSSGLLKSRARQAAVFQKASVARLSSFSSSAAVGTVKAFVKYCISIFPDSCASAIPEYVFCCPESPNTAMAVTLRGGQKTSVTYQSRQI